jgi:phosphatidylglycerol:prolipoprotein diacylglycerol transferase
VLINRKWRKKLYAGDLFLLYLVLYPSIRFLLEFMRLDPSPVNGININQTSMLVVLIIAVLLLVLRHTGLGRKTRGKGKNSGPGPRCWV